MKRPCIIRLVLLDSMRKNDWPVTFSIGMVTYNEPPASVDEMIKAADTLMYSVKETTKNAVRSSVVG